MFLLICLILALVVGAAVALLLFCKHRHLCNRDPHPNPQEIPIGEQTVDIIYQDVDPPPPYAPTMDGNYTPYDDWIDDLRDALNLASAPQEHPLSPPPPDAGTNHEDTQELEEQDPAGEPQSPLFPLRPQGHDARASRDPRLMKALTRKALGELIFFAYECPNLMYAFRNLLVTTFGYLAHLCHSQPVRSILNAAQIQASTQGAPYGCSTIGLTKEVTLLRTYYIRVAQAIEGDRGECWNTPEEAYRDTEYMRTRDSLAYHLDYLWRCAQHWVKMQEDPDTAPHRAVYQPLLSDPTLE